MCVGVDGVWDVHPSGNLLDDRHHLVGGVDAGALPLEPLPLDCDVYEIRRMKKGALTFEEPLQPNRLIHALV